MQSFSKILVIVNPRAGFQRPRKVFDIVEQYMKEKGYTFTLRQTENAGDSLRWARSARAEGFDLIVVAGGDGTIREVVEGLMRSTSQIPLLQIPTGSANVMARTMGISLDIRRALDLIADGKVVRFDVGYLPDHDRYFTFVAGAGWDARLIHDTPRQLKKRLGFFAYVLTGIKHFFGIRPVKVRLEVDQEIHELRAHTIIAINSMSVPELDWQLAPNISPHDGKLNIIVVSTTSMWGGLLVIMKILTKRYHGYARLRHMEGHRIRVTSEEPLPLEIDGEAMGTTPFLAEVIHDAMQFVVPIDYHA